MNLKHLFELQAKLDDYIEREHPRQPGEDRPAKKILALLVELGELANEARFFKFWSHDQEPRTQVPDFDEWKKNGYPTHKGKPVMCFRNRVLEEYVDCLHFILSIGLEIKYGTEYNPKPEINVFVSKAIYKEKSIVNQFNLVFELASSMSNDDYYFELFASFIHLGEMLGFTWEQIEEAYMKKNAINYARQDSGVY